MKEGIHPKYDFVTVSCACGNTFVTRSTLMPEIRLDICSACHPFFTGRQKLVDSAGRVDRFVKKAAQKSEEKKIKKIRAREEKVTRKISKSTQKKEKIKILSTSISRARAGDVSRKKKDKKSSSAAGAGEGKK